ncbi:MAG: FAD-binding domain-containing protein [Myxococcota bacterium]
MSTSPIAELPFVLAERVRPLSPAPIVEGGAFVLYWMRTAARGHENPALDVAIRIANRLGVPAFVYHAVSERYPYASDRHHRFILEGARDACAAVRARGVGYAFHLERPGHRGPFLKQLAARAAVVITEEMPVQPLALWTGRLAASIAPPVWCVDTACVVPMRLIGMAHTRAFAFRKATETLRRERRGRPWAEAAPNHEMFVPDLPFVPVELAEADLSALIAQCDIDHTIGPVPHTRGGAQAGYARWDAFLAEGLKYYARDRNDPLRDGVSRMSAYLHYGHVAPTRIVREASERGGTGAEKYLDEVLIWRELAYSYCFYEPAHDSVAALPEWALTTLSVHSHDERPMLPTFEALARGRTGDALWDAAQRALLIHGELHNNVRMTWGKALLMWTRGPGEALSRLVDLNHRYALDGRDPASYGGLLWCMGQFDRPFQPAQPVIGEIRPRYTDDQARRLNVAAFARKTNRPLYEDPPSTAIIGGGVAGASLARLLTDHAYPNTLFGPEATGAPQTVSLKTGWPGRLASSWTADGLITPTDAADRYRVDPVQLATALSPTWPEPMPSRVEHTAAGWRVIEPDGDVHGPFDALVFADDMVALAMGVALKGFDAERQVGICEAGDVEAQLLAGAAMAGRLLNRFADRAPVMEAGPRQADLFRSSAKSVESVAGLVEGTL